MTAGTSATHLSPDVNAEVAELVQRSSLAAVTLVDVAATNHVLAHSGLINVATNVSAEAGLQAGVLQVRLQFDVRATEAVRADEPVYDVRFSFVASFNTEVAEQPSPAAMEAFTGTTGMLVIYPYAREFLQATTGRMGMTPVVLPLFQIEPAAK